MPGGSRLLRRLRGDAVGTIKAIDGSKITLTTDAGATVSISLQDSTRLLRIEPGEKDLKNAVKITQQDLQPGDRILVVGEASPDGHTIVAASVMAMKHADVVSKQQSDLQDWQRRGVGGLVKSVDPASGTITISVTTAGVAKPVTIQTSKSTILRRYDPNSVKFDDAKVSTLDQVKPGDQLRARGTKNADGSEVAADEIVSGAFRNLSGLITSIDAGANTLTVNDLATKKPVRVKIATDSQIRKLPPQMAQLLAGRRTRRSGRWRPWCWRRCRCRAGRTNRWRSRRRSWPRRPRIRRARRCRPEPDAHPIARVQFDGFAKGRRCDDRINRGHHQRWSDRDHSSERC